MNIRKIMLVDDEPDIRKVGTLSLKHVGKWEVVAVSSGTEAGAVAVREQPDVILLDVMMPVQDGPTTLAKIRQEPATARIPVIFMTAKAQRHEVERLLGLGAAGVITKPFDPIALPEDIKRIVKGTLT